MPHPSPAPSRAAYVGRYAPSPTGPLHAGSLVAALASWLDAGAHDGRWLVRIEDVDRPRCIAGADREILAQLAACGLVADDVVLYQSRRTKAYAQALQHLLASGWAYPCGCTRRDLEAALPPGTRARHTELVYPGTCREGLAGKPARAARLLVAASPAPSAEPLHIDWHDRRLGAQHQDVTHEVGDFVLKRADGRWAYQLAVVVDDAEQGVSHVVRGADLADNTPRQIHLQHCLGLPTPLYLHTPLVLGADGEKLSKQNGAQALDLRHPLAALQAAGRALGLQPEGRTLTDWLAHATAQWCERWACEA
jgi:glutamyl-Q tRNA(Asp) synthetase